MSKKHDVFLLILWLAIGVIVISGAEVTKGHYFFCWLVLILELLENVVENIIEE